MSGVTETKRSSGGTRPASAFETFVLHFQDVLRVLNWSTVESGLKSCRSLILRRAECASAGFRPSNANCIS